MALCKVRLDVPESADLKILGSDTSHGDAGTITIHEEKRPWFLHNPCSVLAMTLSCRGLLSSVKKAL